ncbi:hypothetical protein B0920_23030 [Massilia sp. KIM]|uniref:DUF4214 domain-containing protein n=1 Tax=Massilia sp. KIM TaxID=1955422 RepID=UPI00098F99F4|nr:DUF4214 domain-containing protein [Massilia sp. KIM]OON59271.1 hypothetical protein B0920_23030 [Massilia sp. KIM]
MAKVSDITTTPVSGLQHIDALLDEGPDWNYLTAPGNANTIYYTFSIASGNEKDRTGQEAFSFAQQVSARTAFSYLQEITGIRFVETAVGTDAQIHLANLDIADRSTTGLCSWNSPYSHYADGTLSTYDADAYIYMDNREHAAQNADLRPGGYGYETLLHELGHALGLKHPFTDDIRLPTAQDNTANTLMSYRDVGGPHSEFSPYDIAALNWLYGGDGLKGGLGINSATGARYLTGTGSADVLTGGAANDVLEGGGGNDVLVGGAGEDTAVFARSRSAYSFSENASGELLAFNANEGTIRLSGVEVLRFTDGSYQRAQLTSDQTAPAAPTLAVTKNAAGFATGNKPLVSGQAEANAIIKIYAGTTQVGETKANESGIWSVVTSTAFPDGRNYSVYATATDAAGNVSVVSQPASFHVDATAPSAPTSVMALAAGSNAASFSGTGEVGSTILLVEVNAGIELGRATVQANGSWRIDKLLLPNANYQVRAASEDAAGNATSAQTSHSFQVNSALNANGTAANDVFTPGAGDNAINGGAGLDTVVYNGNRADFTVQRGVFGVTVTDKSGALGSDNLVNVERIRFNDTMVGLDVGEGEVTGLTYRLYRAAFDREPDKAGMAFWIKALDTGNYTGQDIAKLFINDKEFIDMYMSDPSDENFVTKLYAHVLHRPAEGAGFDFWVNGLKQSTRAEVLAFFSESPENQAQVIGSIVHGVDFPLPAA